ncbi:hypothetical protein EJ06DRAFT_526656 [Trichodelitschia bisporula]|uniref:Uncharacterized protein n=1 Tax=Trichodelitschia bisporula TaxID=703511 RepID=A0A6G1I8D7_9PEZI|nr:hypothetical protein EJ06DRAFT_526656 [Trichodelitschia bisporula]
MSTVSLAPHHPTRSPQPYPHPRAKRPTNAATNPQARTPALPQCQVSAAPEPHHARRAHVAGPQRQRRTSALD